MRTLRFGCWIANAAAGLTGDYGAVTDQAQQSGCSRQSVYDHTFQVVAALQAQHGGGPTPEELARENQALRPENAQLWDWLFQTVEFPVLKQQEFTVIALAMGLSLNQNRVLLEVVLGAQAAPARSTVHRWGQAAGQAAGVVLKPLDHSCGESVQVGCLDEIFLHGRPVLVGIEPHSLVWFLGKRADNRQGSTWFKELQPWVWLRYVTSDAGSGLKSGLAQLYRYQLAQGRVPLERGLDVFHTQREARRVLRILWKRVQRCWAQAETADRALAQRDRQGRGLWGLTHKVRVKWDKASRAFELYEKREKAWKRAELALKVFRPDGQLNDRAWAQEQVQWALSRLPGSEWAKVRGLLQARESFTFLDRLHNQWDQLSMPEALRTALVQLWWLRRQRPMKSSETSVVRFEHILYLLQKILCQTLDPNWREWYRRVAAVLSQTVRASSAVECLNSVLRMHQSRHRTLTPGMLDLKRLYWNCGVFRGGKRKGRCPYEHLGLELPSYDFGSVLQVEMRTALAAAKAKAKAKKVAIAA
jgi:hypothetical protein